MTNLLSTGARRRQLAGVAALLVVALAAIAVVLLTRGPDPEAGLEDFLAAYEKRDYKAAAALTDGPPRPVAKALKANVEGLDGAALDAEVVSSSESGEQAEATTAMRWRVPGIGRFAYENDRVRLVRSGDRWLVHWTNAVVHPALASGGARLGTERSFEPRAPIMDRDGSGLVIPRPVVEIGVVPAKLRGREAAIEAIAAATDADPKALRRSIEGAASPKSFVPAITLRQRQFDRIRDRLEPIPGIEFGARELPLAPTKEFAHALLGSVGPITAEQLKKLGKRYGVSDNVGQSGLQARFEGRLAGTPTRRVITRRADGSPAKTLLEIDGKPGKPLRTTLDSGVQLAAERALGDGVDVGAVVAVQPSSGDVLAVAGRPVEDGFNRALDGRYPPGSTFKVITTAALLAGGLDPDETVPCPRRIRVSGRAFRNFEGGAAGAVPFRRDFADSCNTAFISLADSLRPEDLRDAGRRFGLGRDHLSAVSTFAGQVPVPRTDVEQAASMIGQGRILVSPLAIAGVAATVADGRWRSPRLLASDRREAGPPIPGADRDELRTMMRSVVTSGTGTALADVPGEPIGKSGTAEYGSGDPPPTHAWFIAARGDLAVAVLVEDKPSGGEFAAPIAADFFAALDGG